MNGTSNNSLIENFILEELHKLQIYVEDLRYCENHRQENDRIAQNNFRTLNKRIHQYEGLDAIRALALKIAQTLLPDDQMNTVQEMIFKKYHHILIQQSFCFL